MNHAAEYKPRGLVGDPIHAGSCAWASPSFQQSERAIGWRVVSKLLALHDARRCEPLGARSDSDAAAARRSEEAGSADCAHDGRTAR